MASTMYAEPQWKIPGYTGYVRGLYETVGDKTPVMCQERAVHPSPGEFLHTREHVAALPTPARDPCNFLDVSTAEKAPVNLWASLQTTGKQDTAKPSVSRLQLGDGRLEPFNTSYGAEFHAPFPASRRLRSPLRNRGLRDVADLRDLYRSAFQRVGEKRLSDMLEHMTERIAGKVGNANNNAFKLRKLFSMYDVPKTGLVELEDFRVMTESFGMQLDDDSLLALYSRFDPEARGMLEYDVLMKGLLDEDLYALYHSPAPAPTMASAPGAAAAKAPAGAVTEVQPLEGL